MNVAQDHHGIAVHAMTPVHRMGPVFYAFLPHETQPTKVRGTDAGEARRHLVSILWEHIVTTDSRYLRCHPSFNVAASSIRVVHASLGKPHLLLGEYRGPAISFSEGGGSVWAAICGDESDIGIDVADPDEFRGDYPIHRVFTSQELQHVVRLGEGDVGEASALLWSIKEAVVKALGCGFHLVEPLDIHVDPCIEKDGECTFPVRLSGKALDRLSIDAGQPIWVRSLPQAKMWLSIAFLNWQRC